MPDPPSLDPTGSAFHWALKRGGEHLDRFLVGGVVLGVAAIGAGNFLVAPETATGLERFGYSVAAFLVAVLLAVGAAYGWALLRAPYEQRDALRSIVKASEQQLKSEGDRRKQLLKSRELKDEKFYVWELFELGEKPLIKSRIFEDCTITGPAIVMLIDCELGDNTIGEPPLDAHLYEQIGPDGYRRGVVGFVNCKFYQCRFVDIGFYGPKSFIDELRAVTRHL